MPELRTHCGRPKHQECASNSPSWVLWPNLAPRSTIAYDMFQLAGGKPWLAHQAQPVFCSMDAGHRKERYQSRWVQVTTDANHAFSVIKTVETMLAQHIPTAALEAMWPTGAEALIYRDGKLSQEKVGFENRAAAENRPLIESKKSPRAILWRQTGTNLHPAHFGDAVIDPHDDLLLQTVPQFVQDYIHPVRLTLQGGDPIGLVTNHLHQQAVLGLSLFRMSRLLGALYYADLISKLSGDGWPKAIGRGFNLPNIIPQGESVS